MFKETLPANCPPLKAFEKEIILFRIFKNETLSAIEFLPYTVEFPNIERYKTMCDAYAISFFSTYDQAVACYKKAMEKGNANIGKYIAEVIVKPEHGKIKITENSGHCNLWLYSSAEVEKIETVRIVEIE
jgi:hypothetical protein